MKSGFLLLRHIFLSVLTFIKYKKNDLREEYNTSEESRNDFFSLVLAFELLLFFRFFFFAVISSSIYFFF